MEKVTQIAQHLKGLIRLIVDFPDEVEVTPIVDGKGFVLEIAVAGRDLGKVIGKMGRTARSLRNVVQAISTAHNVRITVDIVGGAPQSEAASSEVGSELSIR